MATETMSLSRLSLNKSNCTLCKICKQSTCHLEISQVPLQIRLHCCQIKYHLSIIEQIVKFNISLIKRSETHEAKKEERTQGKLKACNKAKVITWVTKLPSMIKDKISYIAHLNLNQNRMTQQAQHPEESIWSIKMAIIIRMEKWLSVRTQRFSTKE